MNAELNFRRIEAALRFLDNQAEKQPGLDALAEAVGISPWHLQRTFRDWAGVSPKRFLQYLTVEHARALLEQANPVMETAYAVGLSGPGRLHDHFVSLVGMTPGEYKAAGAGTVLSYGVFPSPFGPCLLAGTSRGLSYLGFLEDRDQPEAALADIQGRCPAARLEASPARVRGWWEAIFPDRGQRAEVIAAVPLYLRGTPFQVQVWEALLRIPSGRVISYGMLAQFVGKPRAARAVGSAVGANPVSFLVPCHRVIRSMGLTGDYYWGAIRKRAMLGYEAARLEEAGVELPAAAHLASGAAARR